MPKMTPSFSDEQIADLAKDLYGLEGEISSLVSFEDQNAHIKTSQGSYVLKIGNKRWNLDELHMQTEALEHLEVVAPDYTLPRVVPTKSGDTITIVNGHAVRLLTYVEGEIFSKVEKSPELFKSLGSYMGRFTAAMQGFTHEASIRVGDIWNIDNINDCKPFLNDVANDDVRARIVRMFDRFEDNIEPKLKTLRTSVMHNDANEQNLLVSREDVTQVTSLIDFGDLCTSKTINELAITLAYTLFDQDDIIATSRLIIGGYVAEFPLEDRELEILFDLVAMRLVQSILISSNRIKQFPENDYILVSQKQAVALLKKLEAMNFDFLSYAARYCCRADNHDNEKLSSQISNDETHPLFSFSIEKSQTIEISMSEGAEGSDLIADQRAYSEWLNGKIESSGAKFAIGAYGEDRNCYTTANFVDTSSGEPRSVHMGIDIFVPAETGLHAPIAGRVYSVHDNAGALDYGPTIILEHSVPNSGDKFYTLYGHLARKSLSMVREGDEITAGQQIGIIGDMDVNGGWAPHLHIQVMTDMLGNTHDFPGACEASRWDIWQHICPDPTSLIF